MVRTTLPRPARLALRFLAVSGVALATANCATSPQQKLAAAGNGVDPKYGVKASPRLYNEGDVIPKGGGRRYTGKPYVVAGQTYVPKEDPRGYVREGLASWYGSAFHGRMTANGEVFDRHSIAAAHPTLPLPSYARVTNLDNGYSMVVRVNDRGPYHAGRVMDVSEEAAGALGFHRQGTAHVRVEYVGRASVAGSDDRKLLASLRTDGHPAGRSAVMVADLGPTEELERYARSAPAPLAFKPAEGRPQELVQERPEPEAAPAPRPAPVRAPIVLASAAVTVPAAVQPTAPRVREFRPAPVAAGGANLRVAGLNPGAEHAAASKAAAANRPALAEAGRRPAPVPGPARPGLAAPTRLAQAPATMPGPAKLATVRLASAPARGPADKGLIAKTVPHAPVLHAAAPEAHPAKIVIAKFAAAKFAAAKAAPPGTAQSKTAVVKTAMVKTALSDTVTPRGTPTKAAQSKVAPTKTASAGTRPSRMAGIY